MRYITAALAAFGLLLLGTALPATAAETVDYCDPSQKPPTGSIKAWLEAEGQVPSGCVDFTVTVECGLITVDLTNKTSLNYEVRALIDAAPAYTGGEGDDIAGASLGFAEDESDGSADVTLWIEGAEADYLTGSGVPNFWDANAATHTVVTDCEQVVPDPDPKPDPDPDEDPKDEDPVVEDEDEDTDPVAVPTEIPAGEQLPKTGVNPVLAGLVGAGLLGAGGGLLAWQRRKVTSS